MSMVFIKGHILNILVWLLVISFGKISSQDSGNRVLLGYTETCTCSNNSTNEHYCAAWSCNAIYHYSTRNCFSGQSTVVTHGGKAIYLSNIHIGQEVLVFDGNTLVFEPIYDIIHSEKTKFYSFIQLTVLNSNQNWTHSIEISSKHLIFKYGILNPVFASEIQLGDDLQLVDQFQIIPGKVIKIDEIVSQGFSAPLTRSGTIVVNNLVSSNYAEVRHHHLAHLAMQPYRWWRAISGPKQTVETDLNWYISTLYDFADRIGLLHT